MLCNLVIDLNANSVLVFSWMRQEHEAPSEVFFTLLVERASLYAPVTLSHGPYESSWAASRAALAVISNGRLFKVAKGRADDPPFLSLLEANLGKDFNKCWHACLSHTDMPDGCLYTEIEEYGEFTIRS